MRKGEKMTMEQKVKISLASKGRKNPYAADISRRPGVRALLSLQKLGNKNPNWKGGKRIEQGYLWVAHQGFHPRKTNTYVKNCVLVAENLLGRFLTNKELVHHIDGVRLNDKPDNLYICSRSEHRRIHNLNLIVKSNIICQALNA